MVDRALTARLLRVLSDNLVALRRYRGAHTRDAFLADPDLQNMVEYAMYKAIQVSIDLALHWCADEGLPSVDTYGDAFRRLGETGRIPGELATRLGGWAGLRNVLAHLYAQVDAGKVFDALDELGDLEAFAAIVAGL